MRKWLLTCEHGGNEIPLEFAQALAIPKAVLNSHRGLDIGALALARHLADVLAADAYEENMVTRLLIDFNRSLRHRGVFSEYAEALSELQRQQLIQQYYLPYRQTVTQYITQWIAQGHEVIHVSVHSFTPVWQGVARNADIGLLYDPKRTLEVVLAQQWRQHFLEMGEYRVRCNYPYRGVADGFTTALRKQFTRSYVGIELETNQALWQKNTALIEKTQRSIAQVLKL